MHRFSSITARLILSLTLVTTLLWCGAATYASLISYRELNEAFDRTLEQSARHLLPLAIDDVLGRTGGAARAINPIVEGQEEYLSYQLTDASGRTILRSDGAPSVPCEEGAAPGISSFGKYRIYCLHDSASGFVIAVAEDTRDRSEAVIRGARGMALSLVGLVPLSVLAIWLAVGSAMKPVGRLSDDISRRSGRNLAALDISGQPSELRPIAEATASLIERLRAALDAERAFAANSAHELRTPIAGALAQTQRMIAELVDPKDRRRAREAETTLKHLSTLAEKLMQLSRIDAGVSRGDKDVDLVPVLDLVVRDCAKRLGEPERLHYAKPECAKLIARMDMDAFAIAVRNLIDNAANHGTVDGRIDVLLGPDGVIRIINDGPIVPPAILASLKARFARGETRHAGAGLGLSIVDTIMGQTEGRLELFSPPPGYQRGFEARLSVKTAQSGDMPGMKSRHESGGGKSPAESVSLAGPSGV